jgi:Na+:H+ antiporter, NhaA family
MVETDIKARGIRAFFQHEAAGGVVLVLAAIVAMVCSNSALYAPYHALITLPLGTTVAGMAVHLPLELWINDALMAVFFLLVGLELKRELRVGKLSSRAQAMLPLMAALGGIAVPALIFTALNAGDPHAMRGWAIPTATDIAFALGVLALLGERVPASLKIFLLALAIIDDLAAILIIALFYTEQLALIPLGCAGAGLLALALLNGAGVLRLWPYLLIGGLVWIGVFQSGIHATLAGVATALFIPLGSKNGGPKNVNQKNERSPLKSLEEALHPWVVFGILPLFAFVNAGVPLGGMRMEDAFAAKPLGIALGLFVGKQVGIFGAAWLAVRSGLGSKPAGASWAQLYGVAILGGIGFTMSLFIGMLAYSDPASAAMVRIGVLGGSILSAVVGYGVLRLATAPGGRVPVTTVS